MSEKICCLGSLSPFCLAMTDYNCCGIPEPKHKKLSFIKEEAKAIIVGDLEFLSTIVLEKLADNIPKTGRQTTVDIIVMCTMLIRLCSNSVLQGRLSRLT